MKRLLLLALPLVLLHINSYAQNSSLIVLGDMHYDLLEDHDMDWLSQKPGDLRQVTENLQDWEDFLLKIS